MTAPIEHDVRCVVHVHSTHSDGTASVPEIVACARANGVRVVVLTDHDTLGAREAGEEGWHDDVLVVVGHEISPRAGHLLALGTDRVIPHAGRSEEELCAAVVAAGGFGIAAHPFSEGSRMSRRIGRPHPWRALDAPGCVGIELWSLTTDAAEGWRTPAEAVRFLRDPVAALDGPPRRHLERWDALSARRPTPAVGGLDAHQPGLRWRDRTLSFMPNRRYFGLLHTHLHLDRPLGGETDADVAAVLDALRDGRCHLGLTAFGDTAGFSFRAESGGRRLAMGAEAPAGGWTLRARAPADCDLVLLCDGRPVRRTAGRALDHRTDEPGVWRVEGRLMARGRQRTWIVSNPVHLR